MNDKPKRLALYLRVSTGDQHVSNQERDLKAMADQRGWEIVGTYADVGISGAKAKRPQLDQLMHDARRGKFDALAVTAFDRMARSTKHLLEVMDELQRCGVEFVSLREGVDTAGALGRAISTIVGAVAQLERDLIAERVRSGIRRARADGKRHGRPSVDIKPEQFIVDRKTNSLTQLAKKYDCSRTAVAKFQRDLIKRGWLVRKRVEKADAERPYFQHAQGAD